MPGDAAPAAGGGLIPVDIDATLAIMLRLGNARLNTASDYIEAHPARPGPAPADARRRVLIRADSGGGTHEFLAWLARPGRRLAYPRVLGAYFFLARFRWVE